MARRRKMRVLVRHADWEWEIMEGESAESRADMDALCRKVRDLIAMIIRGEKHAATPDTTRTR